MDNSCMMKVLLREAAAGCEHMCEAWATRRRHAARERHTLAINASASAKTVSLVLTASAIRIAMQEPVLLEVSRPWPVIPPHLSAIDRRTMVG